MTETLRYALPLLQSGQAQKEITHNEALGRIDALLHLAVDTRQNATPAAVDGMTWIIGPAPDNPWADHAGAIATFDESGWSIIAPHDGCIAYLRSERNLHSFRNGGAWRNGWPVTSLSSRRTRNLRCQTDRQLPCRRVERWSTSKRGRALNQLVAALRDLQLIRAA